MNIIIKKLLGALYPERCALCDCLLKRDEHFVCRSCRSEMSFIKGRTCVKCGKALRSLYEEECSECAQLDHDFDEALAPFSYSGKVRDSILRLKYHSRAQYGGFYARCILRYGAEKIERWKADMIIPVPVHYTRYLKRGYDQAALIARELSMLTGIPVNEKVIKRVKKTKAQKELSRIMRRANLISAFSYVYTEELPERIMIVDDILTTGSTADAVSHILRQHGARYIYVVCAGVS